MDEYQSAFLWVKPLVHLMLSRVVSQHSIQHHIDNLTGDRRDEACVASVAPSSESGGASTAEADYAGWPCSDWLQCFRPGDNAEHDDDEDLTAPVYPYHDEERGYEADDDEPSRKRQRVISI